MVSTKRPPRLLVIRGGAVGDFVLTLPVLGALRRAMPEAWIEVLGQPSRARLARHPCYADRVTDMDAVKLYHVFQSGAVLPDTLQQYLQAWTHIVSYVPPQATAFVATLQRTARGQVITWSPHPDGSRHITEHLLLAVTDWIDAAADPCPHVYLDAASQTVAERVWQERGLPAAGVLAMHPGSGGSHKLWPLEGWQQVMTWAARQGIPGLVICGPAEEEQLLDRVLPILPASWACVRHMPLPHLAALLARCDLVVGHDSGVSHLAAAVGTAVLALFGPTSPHVWGPRSPRACVLQPEFPQQLTLRNLPPEIVIAMLEAMLQQRGTVVAEQTPCRIVPVAR